MAHGMKPARLIVVAMLVLVVVASASVALVAAGRFALLVGSSTYAHIGRLPMPATLHVGQ